MLIEGDLAARRELDREQLMLGGLLAAGLAVGVALGQPVAAAILAVALYAGWRVTGFAGVFAVCLAALAVGSSSIEELKEAGTDIRWVALGTLALWPAVSGRRLRVAVPRLLMAGGVLLVALSLLSTAWSVDAGLTARRALALAVLAFIALIVVPVHAATRGERRSLVVSLGVLCGVGAIAAIVTAIVSPDLARSSATSFAYFNGLPALPHFGPLRAWMESSNTIGIWCALLLPFLLVWRKRAVSIPLAVAAIGVVLWSYSRAALVILVIVLIWQIWSNRPRRVVLTVALLAVAVLATPLRTTLVTNTALAKFNRAGGSERSLFGGRLEAWDATADLVRAAPAGGYGFGTGDRLFRLSKADRRFVYFTGNNSANGYFQAVVEVGPLGVLAIVLAFAGGLGVAVRRRPTDRTRSPFVVVGASFAVLGISESVFTSPGSPFTLLMWSSLALAASSIAAAPSDNGAAPSAADPISDTELAELLAARRLVEEGVVATNGSRHHVPVEAGVGNGKRRALGLEIGEEREAQGRVPGDRPA